MAAVSAKQIMKGSIAVGAPAACYCLLLPILGPVFDVKSVAITKKLHSVVPNTVPAKKLAREMAALSNVLHGWLGQAYNHWTQGLPCIFQLGNSSTTLSEASPCLVQRI